MRAGFNEIIPSLLWQRGQFLTWPASRKRKALDERGISVVVNLWHKIDPDLSPERHGPIYLNWHISPSQPADEVSEVIVGTLVYLLETGNGMLVHCEAGHGRSAWLCARLVAAYAGMPFSEALEFVRARVPGMDVRPALAGVA